MTAGIALTLHAPEVGSAIQRRVNAGYALDAARNLAALKQASSLFFYLSLVFGHSLCVIAFKLNCFLSTTLTPQLSSPSLAFASSLACRA